MNERRSLHFTPNGELIARTDLMKSNILRDNYAIRCYATLSAYKERLPITAAENANAEKNTCKWRKIAIWYCALFFKLDALRPKGNGRHFPGGIFNGFLFVEFLLKFIPWSDWQ